MLSLILDNPPPPIFLFVQGPFADSECRSGEKPGFRTERAEGRRDKRAESRGGLRILSV